MVWISLVHSHLVLVDWFKSIASIFRSESGRLLPKSVTSDPTPRSPQSKSVETCTLVLVDKGFHNPPYLSSCFHTSLGYRLREPSSRYVYSNPVLRSVHSLVAHSVFYLPRVTDWSASTSHAARATNGSIFRQRAPDPNNWFGQKVRESREPSAIS